VARQETTTIQVAKRLRDALCMPAFSFASRYSPDLRDKYQVMIKQGKRKGCPTAIMRRLIELANTLDKRDREWVPNGT
jgi:hypothetical protein